MFFFHGTYANGGKGHSQLAGDEAKKPPGLPAGASLQLRSLLRAQHLSGSLWLHGLWLLGQVCVCVCVFMWCVCVCLSFFPRVPFLVSLKNIEGKPTFRLRFFWGGSAFCQIITQTYW